MDDLVTMFQVGGPFMWPILIVGAVAAAIVGERSLVLQGRYAVHADSFLADVHKHVVANGIALAIKKCNATPEAAVPRVVKAALLMANEADEVVANMVAEATLEVAPLIQRRTALLAMLGNVATLLGLLGTIQGLIQAFAAVSEASPEAKAAQLAAGISVAMYTTFFGLLVAVPTLVAHALLMQRTNQLLDEVEVAGARVRNVLSARRRELGRGNVG